MPLPINEFADAFSGWMKEYQQKQTKRYAQRECLTCGKLISESAYSGKDGNFRKHLSAHDTQERALAEHRKQMDKPLRVVDDMIAEEEESDVRPELEVYRNRGGQE